MVVESSTVTFALVLRMVRVVDPPSAKEVDDQPASKVGVSWVCTRPSARKSHTAIRTNTATMPGMKMTAGREYGFMTSEAQFERTRLSSLV